MDGERFGDFLGVFKILPPRHMQEKKYLYYYKYYKMADLDEIPLADLDEIPLHDLDPSQPIIQPQELPIATTIEIPSADLDDSHLEPQAPSTPNAPQPVLRF